MAFLKETRLSDDGYCFACGLYNPHGLHMRVRLEEGQARCRLSLPPHFQGWVDIAHGGVVSTLLDEIMAYAVLFYVGQGLTTRMETTFRRPVPLQRELEVTGWVEEHRGRMARAAARLELADQGLLLAEAQARWLVKLDARGRPVPAELPASAQVCDPALQRRLG